MATRIIVRDEIGPFCVSQEDGARLRARIEPHLSDGEPVVLDFKGVLGHLSVFYNEAIGRLFDTVGAEAVEALLSRDNLSELGAEIYEQSYDHGRWLASLPDEEREAFEKSVDDILEED
jgi:hypothetical protein